MLYGYLKLVHFSRLSHSIFIFNYLKLSGKIETVIGKFILTSKQIQNLSSKTPCLHTSHSAPTFMHPDGDWQLHFTQPLIMPFQAQKLIAWIFFSFLSNLCNLFIKKKKSYLQFSKFALKNVFPCVLVFRLASWIKKEHQLGQSILWCL